MYAAQFNESGTDGITLRYQGGNMILDGKNISTSFTMNIQCDTDIATLPPILEYTGGYDHRNNGAPVMFTKSTWAC